VNLEFELNCLTFTSYRFVVLAQLGTPSLGAALATPVGINSAATMAIPRSLLMS
jgi:hypothetical protein